MAHLTKYNVFISCVAALGAFSYGFGFAIFVTSTGQPGFYEYFKLDPTSDYCATILGAINGLFNFGLATGAIAQGWLADKFGRKPCFVIASTCALIGSALVAGSVAVAMLVTVRLLQGFGLGVLVCLVPLYITEVAPPQHRGMLASLTSMNFALGYLFCAWISVGTYYAKNTTVQWRVPLALTCVGLLVLLILLPSIPETPRYLALSGNHDAAWDVLRKVHHDPNDPDDLAARAEYTQVVRQIECDKMQGNGYLDMFTKPSWRRRSLLAIFIQFAAQSTGVLAIANFLIIIFQSLGMTGVMPLLLYAVWATVGNISLFITMMYLVDRIGRRRLFLIGFPSLFVILLIEGLLQMKYLGSDNKAALGVCAALFYVYLLVYNVCIDAPSFVWIGEIFPTSIRSRGVGLGFFAYSVGAITYTTPSAVALKNIKYNIFFLYAGLCVISGVITYFFIPETTRIPVEEIGALFGDEVVVHLTEDGHGIVEEVGAKTADLAEAHGVENVIVTDNSKPKFTHKEEC